MKLKLIIVAVAILASYLVVTRAPSTSSIAREIELGEAIAYQGNSYRSEWEENAESIEGYLRQKDRHYDKNMPIVTYDLILTTGEYSNPDIVKIANKGGGNYYWSANKQPTGTLVIYHTVPSSLEAQSRLDQLDEGATVTLVGKISKNSEIKSDSGSYVKLMHDNHKFVLVEDCREK